MADEKNLIQSEYDALGGPKLTDNMKLFLDKLWDALASKKEATIMSAAAEAGFDEEGDEEMFIPLCERLTALGLLGAYTELTSDPAQKKIIPGSQKLGVSRTETYGEDDLSRMSVVPEAAVYARVSLVLSERLQSAVAKRPKSEIKKIQPPKPLEGKVEHAVEEDASPLFAKQKIDQDIEQDLDLDTASPEASAVPKDEATSSNAAAPGDSAVAGREGGDSEEHVDLRSVVRGPLEPREPREPVQEGKKDASSSKNKVNSAKKIKKDRASAPKDDLRSPEAKVGGLPSTGAKTRAPAEAEAEAEAKVEPPRGAVVPEGHGEEVDDMDTKDAATRNQLVAGEPQTIDGLSQPSIAEAYGAAGLVTLGDVSADATGLDDSDVRLFAASRLEADTIANIKKGKLKLPSPSKSPSEVVVGRTRAFASRGLLAAVGLLIAGVVVYMAVNQKNDIAETTNKIEEHLETPTEGLRLVKKAELEALKARLESLSAQNEALRRERGDAVAVGVSEALKKSDEDAKRREDEAYSRGKQDATGLSMSTRERVAVLSLSRAVVNGECEAFGRGNRVDKVYPTNLSVSVLYWMVDPSSLRLSGVVATNEELLTRSDGPVTQIRCLVGRSDIWPSYGEPAMAADGQSRPLGKDGQPQETNPLLR